MCNRLDTIQTVWQTDGQSSCDGIVRAMHTRREVKIGSLFHLYIGWDCSLRNIESKCYNALYDTIVLL